MNIRTILSIVFALCVTVMSAKDIKEIRLTTEPPFRCANCENKIKDALNSDKGVEEVVTDIKSQCVTITYDSDKTTPETLSTILDKLGYKCRPFNACQGEEQNCTDTDSAKNVCNDADCVNVKK